MASMIHTVVLETDSKRADLEHGSIFFIGTATVLLRSAGFTILTDPNFLRMGDKAPLGYGFKARRLLNPAISLDRLPPVDLVLLSHMHEDHFDRTVMRKLNKLTPIVTTPQATRTLQKKGFRRVYPLATWEKLSMIKGGRTLHITAMPGRHGPGPVSKLLPAVMGSMLEFEPVVGKVATRIYISGDTLPYKALREIPKRYPAIDIALLHLGGTKLAGLTVTMNGQQGVEVAKLIKAQTTVPIHYNDYDVFKSPLNDFIKECARAHISDHVHTLMHGETYTFTVPHHS